MEVVEHETESWFLLTDDNKYYLDIQCRLSGYSFALLIELAEDESVNYRKSGKEVIRALAERVRRSPQMYYGRNQSVELQKRVGTVIVRWRERSGASQTS